MSRPLLRLEELRFIVRQHGFSVRVIARQFKITIRTLERQFGERFQTSPRAWVMRERVDYATSLLAQGLSNKEVAARLNYGGESHFCRDFKRHFGRPPQEFMRASETINGFCPRTCDVASRDSQPQPLEVLDNIDYLI